MRIRLLTQLTLGGGLSLIAFAAVLHFFSYLNPDSAWLLIAGERLIEGQTLYLDIGETNPPLVVWLHAGIATLSQLTDLPLPHAFVLVVALMSAISLLACLRCNRAHSALNLAVAVAISVGVAQHYGQREHWFMLLALPYFLSLLPGNRPRNWAAIPAAIGLLLKPHFVFILVALLVVRLGQARSLRGVVHGGTAWLVVIAAAYTTYLWWDDIYWHSTAQLLLAQYHAFHAPAEVVARRMLILGSLALLPYVLWRVSKGRVIGSSRSQTVDALAMMVLAALLVVWTQHKGWSNHWLPFTVLNWVLMVALINQIAGNTQRFAHKLVLSLALLNLALMAYTAGITSRNLLAQDWPTQANEQVALLQNEQAQNQSLQVLSFDMRAGFPSLLYVPMQLAGAYPHLWFLPGMYWDRVEQADQPVRYRTPEEMDAAERNRFEAVIQTLVRDRPNWVVVTERDNYYHPKTGTYGFDFVQYYSQSKEFSDAWSDYKAVAKIGDQRYYRRP